MERLEDKSVLDFSRDFGFYPQPKGEKYEEFFGKKARKRRKRRRELRKEGLSRKEARQQARKEVGGSKVGNFLRKASQGAKDKLKKVGNIIKTGALAVPRNAYLLLTKFNYRGWGDKYAVAIKDPAFEKKFRDKWEKLGGRPSVLIRNVNIGKGKKPILCGKKCKQRVKDWEAQQGFDGNPNSGLSMYDFEEYNYPTGVEEVTASIPTASVVTTSFGALLKEAGKKFVEQAPQLIAEGVSQKVVDEIISTNDDPSGYISEQQIADDTQMYADVIENSDLTKDEKRSAIDNINSSIFGGSASQTTKIALLGGVALILGIIVYKIAKR